MQSSVVLLLLSCILITSVAQIKVTDAEQDSLNRAQGDVDEGSCICGLNKEILSKIESIVAQASKEQSCSLASNQKRDEVNNQNQSQADSGQNGSSTLVSSTVPTSSESSNGTTTGSTNGTDDASISLGNESSSTPAAATAAAEQNNNGAQSNNTGSLLDKLTSEIQALQAQFAAMKPAASSQQGSVLAPLGQVNWRPNIEQQQVQQSGTQDAQNQSPSTSGTISAQVPSSVPDQASTNSGSTTTRPAGSSNNNELSSSNGANGGSSFVRPDLSLGASFSGSVTSNGFLVGLPQTSISLGTQSNGQTKPVILPAGQSQQNSNQGGEAGIQTAQEVQSAVETTVPNVVSNIFSNIQDLAIQTEQNPNAASSGPGSNSNILTSIDGSSVQLNKNDTSEQITAVGEQLFLQWIEHQIQIFHMTASMASYIRKNAINLFRRIVKQYVQRIGKLGGTVEDNVRRATQVALNNTQNLISFLLRNYLNVAGGLMQIIGEQVSRVGKQLDLTGDTIAHINLNPFDIVSNVIDSLPNPSRYSEYFRAFGKYLMGESSTQPSNSNGQQQQQQQQNGGNQQQQHEDPSKGLFSKTMGALGKTLGHWLG